MIITHFNMQRIVSLSVGMEKLRHSVKYIITLKIISIIVLGICNQNHDQGSFKRNTHRNTKQIKLIAEFHLNGHSFT